MEIPQNSELLNEVKKLNRSVAMISAAFVVMAAGMVFQIYMTSQWAFRFNDTFEETKDYYSSNNFDGYNYDLRKDYTKLLSEGKTDELVAMARANMETNPNHADSIYYLAQGLIMQEHCEEVDELLDRLVLVAPSWKSNYIDPLREVCEKKKTQ